MSGAYPLTWSFANCRQAPATSAELATRLGISRNGHLSRHLAELSLAGFVEATGDVDIRNGDATKRIVYRIRDNYVRTVLVFDGTLSAQLESDNYFDHLLPADQLLLGR